MILKPFFFLTLTEKYLKHCPFTILTMIELGGNIKLDGFDGVEPGQLVVIKKIVGSFAKKVADNKGGFDSFEVYKNEGDSITVRIVKGDNVQESNSGEGNLFFSLSKALMQATEAFSP